jgi:hypothetical protein
MLAMRPNRRRSPPLAGTEVVEVVKVEVPCKGPMHAMHAMHAIHKTLSAQAASLQPTDGALRNGVSSYRVKKTLAFHALDDFAQRAGETLPVLADTRLFLGSVDGELVVSARLRTDEAARAPQTTNRSKKRGRDDCAERAERAVASIRLHTHTAELSAAVDLAKATIEELLRTVKGPAGEELFEACGLSLAAEQLTTASASAGATSASASSLRQRPKLIIAARLAAGVPVPLLKLKRALGGCFKDGMVTVDAASLDPSYHLPLTEAGQAVENAGQRSIVLFAAVPTS